MSIAKASKEKSDLYIIPRFENANDLARKIASKYIFRRVKVVNKALVDRIFKYDTKSKFSYNLHLIYRYLRINSFAKKMIDVNTKYDRAFMSVQSSVTRLLYLFLLKKHNTKQAFFEDGDGTYLRSYTLFDSGTKKTRLLQKVFVGKQQTPAKELYIYSPSLYNGLKNKKFDKIRKVDCLWKTDPDLLYDLFDCGKSKYISNQVIILDTLKNEVFDKKQQIEFDRIYNTIYSIMDNTSIIIKRHPRDTSAKIKERKYFDDTSVPFEALCAYSDMNKKVLISYSSTAIMSSICQLEQYPYVILLYKLVDNKFCNSAERDRLYQRLKMLYNDKEKFFIPQTVSELESICRLISRDLERS